MSALEKLLKVKETLLSGSVEKVYSDDWTAEWEDKPTVGLVREAVALQESQ